MRNLKNTLKAFIIAIIALSFSAFYPLTAMAQEATSTTPSTTGPQKPNGDAAKTYTYNESTGLWENDHYTWNPTTKQTAPKQEQNYSYNPETKKWDTTEYKYNATSGKYEPNVKTVERVPANSDSPAKAGTRDQTTTTGNIELDETANVNTNNDNDSSEIKNDTSNTGAFDLFYDANISNTIDSKAKTGNATVSGNTSAGNATTGDALAVANVVNMLQSLWGDFREEGFVPFVQNIFGNVVGDLFIDPGSLAPGSNNSVNSAQNNQIEVNIANDSTINNNIDLTAQSGNAAVTQNTQGGNATSGSATAMANVVNMINSIIGSGQSFFGMLNIYGNLEGDVLLPQQFLHNLLASNAPSVTFDAAKVSNQEVLANFTDNQNINNNVELSATSGKATVSNNTTGGNATTGDAATKLTLFNLTGKQIVGSDSLLVFVNVLGEWVGMIVNAPDATAAALGSANIAETNPSNTTATANVVNNSTINNNIKASAASGSATVAENTTAGNATTGAASVAANILNVTNSTINLSNWFGILFINVFGSWHGSFGINTAYGNPPATPTGSSGTSSGYNSLPMQAFAFVPSNGSYRAQSVSLPRGAQEQIYTAVANMDQGDTGSQVAGLTNNSDDGSGSSPSVAGVTEAAKRNWTIPVFGSLAALALFGGERLLSLRDRRRLLPHA